MVNRLKGWLWIIGAVAGLIAVESLARWGPLVALNGLLNGARPVVPVCIAVAVVGAGLLAAASIHGMVFDSTRVAPGKIAVGYSRPGARGGWMAGFFRGTLLWGGHFEEETALGELKRSWRSGEWLTVHRYLRATMVLVGLPLLVAGTFTAVAIGVDVVWFRLVLLLAVVYALARIGYAVVRA